MADIRIPDYLIPSAPIGGDFLKADEPPPRGVPRGFPFPSQKEFEIAVLVRELDWANRRIEGYLPSSSRFDPTRGRLEDMVDQRHHLLEDLRRQGLDQVAIDQRLAEYRMPHVELEPLMPAAPPPAPDDLTALFGYHGVGPYNTLPLPEPEPDVPFGFPK